MFIILVLGVGVRAFCQSWQHFLLRQYLYTIARIPLAASPSQCTSRHAI